MRDTAKRTIVVSIIVTSVGMFLNLLEFSMGSFATIKNLLVTFTYIAAWIINVVC